MRKMKYKISDITKVVFALLCIIMLTGCEGGDLKLSEAKKSAQKYIKEKYGINANIIDANTNMSTDNYGYGVNFKNSSTVKMEYEGHKFEVQSILNDNRNNFLH